MDKSSKHNSSSTRVEWLAPTRRHHIRSTHAHWLSQRSKSRHLTAPFRSKSSFRGPNRSRAGRGAYRVELYAVPVMRGARIHRAERTETDDDASGVRHGIFMTRQIKLNLLRPISTHFGPFWPPERLRQPTTTFTSCKIARQESVAHTYNAGSAMESSVSG